ncbi:MBL fold metallo-hydrolase [Pseudomonas sp. BP8]|uniref:MBL fold metallo-hydrolase n=1 Tax=Pseudomonas sp. BP8 TaxID=2817864 RepID=UPI001AE51AC2|nr:MBL fold metallo-hydrolase [Pseudomonas sp. BP8]MBP2261550.1 ribonuclease BN (tRNA processing enzyme) [Pseudomonas sp. BP8]HDS1733459.1 MBL fold metallo-hydrolase [Pseudomonas putida]
MNKATAFKTALCGALLAPLLAMAAETDKPTQPYWTTLGVAGGPIIQGNAAQSIHALVAGDAVYVFDMGYGGVRQLAKAGLGLNKVKALFLTHHHPDHNADLGFFLVSKWLFGGPQPVQIYGPPGTKVLVDGLIKANAPTLQASFPVSGKGNGDLAALVNVTELDDRIDSPQAIYKDATVSISAISVDHYQVAPSIAIEGHPDAVAYRADVQHGRSFVYTGDSGKTENLLKLSKGADVLVSEVIDMPSIDKKLRTHMKDAPAGMLDKIVDNLEHNHLAPDFIGQLANQAQIKEVVLTHFVPPLEEGADTSRYSKGISRHFDGPVKIGQELGRY